ncbi:unnamed protein product [Eruca vesicaria subsp. sativa]|uniref:Uncharacterized protein n=1 Tax=Eruca vesicaria subsp. sativa TaxID=29727 RepID=A0ABC8JTZ6_ERUVS|nr:unnamed protein product [Eruca vesicaria subsp. sativa]
MGVNGHGELDWKQQSLGRLVVRRHRRSRVLSRAIGEQSEVVGAIVSRFESAFLSVARGAWLPTILCKV